MADRRNQWQQQSNARHTDYVWIPSDKVGMLIGRNGIKINELQSTSGARIQVDRNQSHNGNTRVNLTGSHEAKNKARSLIKEIISEDNNSRYGNYFNSIPNSSNNRDDTPIEEDRGWDDYIETPKVEVSLPPILKQFYVEDPAVAAMSVERVAQWRLENNRINIKQIDRDLNEIHDFKIPNPVLKFDQIFKDYPEILEGIKKQGLSRPTPFQSQAWPVLLSGYNLIGVAQRGTGKVLAFLLPCLIHIEKQRIPMEEKEGPNVLIITPTSDHVSNIEEELKRYPYHGIRSVCIYGEPTSRSHVNQPCTGAQVMITTPKKLFDFGSLSPISLKAVTYVILDEADCMINMGYETQLSLVLTKIRPDIQIVATLMTWQEEIIQKVVMRYMSDPVCVTVGSLNLVAVNTATQKFTFTKDDTVKDKLIFKSLQEMNSKDKLVVFCNKKSVIDHIAEKLGTANFHNFQTIEKKSLIRHKEQALEYMRTGGTNVLISEDLNLSWGDIALDLEGATHIINYNFPLNLGVFVREDRFGQTGRAGKRAVAVTYMTEDDMCMVTKVIHILKSAHQSVPHELYEMKTKFSHLLHRKNPHVKNY